MGNTVNYKTCSEQLRCILPTDIAKIVQSYNDYDDKYTEKRDRIVLGKDMSIHNIRKYLDNEYARRRPITVDYSVVNGCIHDFTLVDNEGVILRYRNDGSLDVFRNRCRCNIRLLYGLSKYLNTEVTEGLVNELVMDFRKRLPRYGDSYIDRMY